MTTRLVSTLLYSLLMVTQYTSVAAESNQKTVKEIEVETIELAHPLNSPDIEFSGMAWCGEQLMLLPQYPERLSPFDQPSLYMIHKSRLIAYLDGSDLSAISPTPVKLFENEIRERMAVFDGFEAIACDGSTAWLNIEAKTLFGTFMAYVVPAEVDIQSETPSISIRTDQIRYIKSQSGMINKGDEAATLFKDHLISFHEVNDRRITTKPKVNRIHRLTGEQDQIEFENLPYRITGASEVDEEGRFWLINYKYSGDRFSREADDFLAMQYGEGDSHKTNYNVERLIEYQIKENAIDRVEQPPLQLKMLAKEGRNWEGLVILDGYGFIMVTDKYPTTILGYVPYPNVNR